MFVKQDMFSVRRNEKTKGGSDTPKYYRINRYRISSAINRISSAILRRTIELTDSVRRNEKTKGGSDTPKNYRIKKTPAVAFIIVLVNTRFNFKSCLSLAQENIFSNSFAQSPAGKQSKHKHYSHSGASLQ